MFKELHPKTISGCTVLGKPGKGDERGTCDQTLVCHPDGNCKPRLGCTVGDNPGNGTERGTCDEKLICHSDGECKPGCTVEGSKGDGTSRGSCKIEGQVCFQDGSCRAPSTYFDKAKGKNQLFHYKIF